MFPIPRRWPILTGLVAALLYGANHYRIAGFEHLRVEAVSKAPSQIPSLSDSGSNYPSAANDVYGHGPNSPGMTASYDPTMYGIRQTPIAEPPGGWNVELDLSERFSLFDQNRRLPSTSASQAATKTLPVAKPMPAPAGFHLPNEFPLATDHTGSAFAQPLGAESDTSLVPLPTVVGSADIPDNPFPNATALNSLSSQPTPAGNIRIASFNLDSFGPAKLDKPHVLSLLISILRQYDIVALQDVRSTRDDVLPLLVERLNQSGRRFDYVIGPRVGRTGKYEQFAFVFDTARVETDRYRLYTVDDPQDLLTHEPLVAWFRCKGVAEEEAFTFSLANVHLHRELLSAERATIPNLIDAVMADGRLEDDWILLGDFGSGNAELAAYVKAGVRFAVQDIPTDVSGTNMLDTILFSTAATTEYTGRSGAFDFLRKHNLSLEQAIELSGHLPVWAEFSIREGGLPGRIAPQL